MATRDARWDSEWDRHGDRASGRHGRDEEGHFSTGSCLVSYRPMMRLLAPSLANLRLNGKPARSDREVSLRSRSCSNCFSFAESTASYRAIHDLVKASSPVSRSSVEPPSSRLDVRTACEAPAARSFRFTAYQCPKKEESRAVDEVVSRRCCDDRL